MITIESIPYLKNPALWDQLLANDPVQYTLGYPSDQTYSVAYSTTSAYEDISLLVCDDSLPLAGLQLTLTTSPDGKQELNFFGRQSYLRLNKNVDRLILEKAQKKLAEGFLGLYESLARPVLQFLDMCEAGRLSDFAVALLSAGAVAEPLYKQIIDLTLPEAELKRDLRKSYKSLITWGDKNLDLKTYDSTNITPEIMDQFRELHIAVAGRETKSRAAWDLQLKQIMDGETFIIFGELDNTLVTAALFVHSPLFCFYGVSAAVREMFDKPLSHAVIWRAMMEAKQRGCHTMELGDLSHLYPEKYSDKEKNISMFKRGFGGAAQLFLRIGFPS